jgi:outer membrane lipoprotein SlyB
LEPSPPRDSARRNRYINPILHKKTDLALPRFALPFFLFPGLLPLALTGCGQGYSANTYASTAAQQEANVQRGVIIGVRQVLISADGSIGAATGAAIGGVAGSQVAGSATVTALGAIGGALVGGVAGQAAEQAAADTKGWEYIVQETGDKLVSVTQTSKIALPIGLNVLVIAGTQQARIVPDYTVPLAPPPAAPAPKPAANPPATPNTPTPIEVNVSPTLPDGGAAPVVAASDPTAPPAPSPAPAATPPVPPSTPAVAATPAAMSNTSPATSTQLAPGTSSSSSSSTATP